LSGKVARLSGSRSGHVCGSAIVDRLLELGYENPLVRTRSELDLSHQSDVQRFFEQECPDFVVLAAAKVGGILGNSTYPGDFLYQNLVIQQNVIGAAQSVGVKRLVFLGSSCIYPKLAPQPLKEEYLLSGPLEPTNQWYAVAKIAGVKLCEAFHEQHGSDFVSLMPTNVYGPRDNFDLLTSHVLPALIRKFHEASLKTDGRVTIWGTGAPRREFIFSRDLARACHVVLTTPESQLWAVAPEGMLNVGVGDDLTILELAMLIRDVVGGDVQLDFDSSKPDGTPRKLMDVQRMMRLGWKPETSLRDGLKTTYEWYKNEEPWLEKSR
jgi:GDP-L-fucose synthase